MADTLTLFNLHNDHNFADLIAKEIFHDFDEIKLHIPFGSPIFQCENALFLTELTVGFQVDPSQNYYNNVVKNHVRKIIGENSRIFFDKYYVIFMYVAIGNYRMPGSTSILMPGRSVSDYFLLESENYIIADFYNKRLESIERTREYLKKCFRIKGSTPKVFISYKWQDEDTNLWVEKLYRDLREKHGIDAYLDKFEVDYGESFSDYMTSRIARDCKVMLFVITAAAVRAIDESQNGGVHFEMQIANARRLRDKDFKIIGIYREGEKNTSYLQDHRYIDFRNDKDYEIRLKELSDSLWGLKKKPPLKYNSHAES